MNIDKFMKICKDLVIDDCLFEINEKDVYVVWCCKTLQNMKCLMSTTTKGSHYYEFTYNGDLEEIYMDVYKKIWNCAISNFKEDK